MAAVRGGLRFVGVVTGLDLLSKMVSREAIARMTRRSREGVLSDVHA